MSASEPSSSPTVPSEPPAAEQRLAAFRAGRLLNEFAWYYGQAYVTWNADLFDQARSVSGRLAEAVRLLGRTASVRDELQAMVRHHLNKCCDHFEAQSHSEEIEAANRELEIENRNSDRSTGELQSRYCSRLLEGIEAAACGIIDDIGRLVSEVEDLFRFGIHLDLGVRPFHQPEWMFVLEDDRPVEVAIRPEGSCWGTRRSTRQEIRLPTVIRIQQPEVDPTWLVDFRRRWHDSPVDDRWCPLLAGSGQESVSLGAEELVELLNAIVEQYLRFPDRAVLSCGGGRGALRVGHLQLRKRPRADANNLHRILEAFNLSGWQQDVDNPFPIDEQERKSEAIRQINRGLRYIRIDADGTGEGLSWHWRI